MFRPISTRGCIARATITCALMGSMLTSHALGSEFTWEVAPIGTDWDSALNWAGPLGQVPDGDNDTAIVDGVNDLDPVLTQDRVIGALTISGSGDVHTGDGIDNFFLGVTDTGPHSGTIDISGNGSQLVVYEQPGFDVDVDILNTSNNGRVTLVDGGDVRVDQLMNNSGIVRGAGSVQLGGSGVSTNDGRLSAHGGALVVSATGTASLDLDGGFGGGILEADIDSTLIITAPLDDAIFNGTISIASGGEVSINQHWTLDHLPGAQVSFLGGPDPQVLSAPSAIIGGEVEVFDGHARLQMPLFVGSSADIRLHQGATLEFDGTADIVNADSISVQGANTAFIMNSDVFIGGGSGNFDWDGPGDTSTTVNEGATLTLFVEEVDSSGNRFDGQLFLNSGRVDVTTDAGQWEMAGQLVTDMTLGMPEIDGDTMLVTGTVETLGSQTRILASTIFGSTSEVEVNSGFFIIGGASSVINGGDWIGDGVVVLNPDSATVTAATTVNMPNGRFDLDGGGSGSLTLNAPLTLMVDEYDGPGGAYGNTLIINQDGRLDLQFTSATRPFTVTGDVVLNGAGGGFTSLHFQGNLVNLYGTTTVNGNSTSQSRMRFDGPVQIAASAELNLLGGSSDAPNRILSDAAFTGGGDLKIGTGTQLDISEHATMDVDVHNAGRMELGLDGTGVVLINGNYVQDASGSLGFDIAAVSGADQDWLLSTGLAALDGELEVSTVGSFVPVPGDTYTVATAAVRAGTFDSLAFNTPNAVTVTGSLSYSGTSAFLNILSVEVSGDFNGDLALDCADVDALVAELASGGMDAQFDLNGDASVDMQDLDQWLLDAGELNVDGGYLYGDANLDGAVDGQDFVVWNTNKFTSTPAWCAGDFNADGQINGPDFIIWNTNKFMMSDSAMSVRAVPEPRALTFVLLGVGLVSGLRSRKLR